MHVITVRNVNRALPAGVDWLRSEGIKRPSRNGTVLVSPVPVTTVYERPMERVLYSATRDANPFFHLVEAIWMLSGGNDLDTLTPYVRRMAEYSDDGGQTMPGAYGFRWRRYFGRDQLDWAVRRLRDDPNDRRVVIQMYNCMDDQFKADEGGKDVPCNLLALPLVNAATGALDLTVVCRSNDIIWGAYGANAVHFSVLQEYLARRIECKVGHLYQVSNNYHAYLDVLGDRRGIDYWDGDPYEDDIWFSRPMIGIEDADPAELRSALKGTLSGTPGDRFLAVVVAPMVEAHRIWRTTGAISKETINRVRSPDWRAAGATWLRRRAGA